jgi:hypothetical protein
MRKTDPFHRILTVHPGYGPRAARRATDDTTLLDMDILQTGHGEANGVPDSIGAVRESYATKPIMPVIDAEGCFEMLGGFLDTKWTRRLFWVCMMNGAAGHTYGANGIWQNNRPGDPHGKSPTGDDYGKIPWNEAMQLPGSEQVGFGKRLFTQYPWQRFEPHPEWAVFAGDKIPTGPQSCGIPGSVRLTYVPEVQPIICHELKAQTTYSATYFDPVTGTKKAIGPIESDATGSWTCPPPADCTHDWVLIIEEKAS